MLRYGSYESGTLKYESGTLKKLFSWSLSVPIGTRIVTFINTRCIQISRVNIIQSKCHIFLKSKINNSRKNSLWSMNSGVPYLNTEGPNSEHWDEILWHQLTKDSSLLLHTIHSPFFRRILKKSILFSGFKNQYKKIHKRRKLESIHE